MVPPAAAATSWCWCTEPELPLPPEGITFFLTPPVVLWFVPKRDGLALRAPGDEASFRLNWETW